MHCRKAPPFFLFSEMRDYPAALAYGIRYGLYLCPDMPLGLLTKKSIYKDLDALFPRVSYGGIAAWFFAGGIPAAYSEEEGCPAWSGKSCGIPVPISCALSPLRADLPERLQAEVIRCSQGDARPGDYVLRLASWVRLRPPYRPLFLQARKKLAREKGLLEDLYGWFKAACPSLDKELTHEAMQGHRRIVSLLPFITRGLESRFLSGAQGGTLLAEQTRLLHRGLERPGTARQTQRRMQLWKQRYEEAALS